MDAAMENLDIDAVRAFVLIAELHSFTRAAEALGSTQSAVSLKLKRLETQLGRRLVERTPRVIRLSSEGAAFLLAARELLSAHERALDSFTATPRRLALGISQLLVGAELPALLRRIGNQFPAMVIELRLAGSRELLREFDEGRLDAVVVLRPEGDQREGTPLFRERLEWIAAADATPRPDAPLRLATQGPDCSLRKQAVQALDAAGRAWIEVFVGTGAVVVGAAAAAGLAVAVMTRRTAPAGTVEVGIKLGLPPLPTREVMLYSTVRDAAGREALKALSAGFRSLAVARAA
jgi:DNA-binding transcriptional LysR family regulator